MFSDKLPITYQLAQHLRGEIIRGTYPPGTKLPTEVQFASDYKISVITVQRALKALEEEHLITRKRGKGTFVSELPSHLTKSKSLSTLDMMFSEEFNNETEILERKIIPVPEHLSNAFSQEKELMFIQRLVKKEGIPISFTNHYIVPEYGKGIPVSQLKRYPMFRILRENMDISLLNVEISIEAMAAPIDVSKKLNIPAMEPVLFFTALLYEEGGRLIDVPEIYFRGSRHKFSFGIDLASR
jgi:GntR family transcriptional regulator